MLGMSKNKNEESEKIRVSIEEMNAQLQKCEKIEEIELDLDKYDKILEHIHGCVEGNILEAASEEGVDLAKAKELLLSKEQVLDQTRGQFVEFENEYKKFIEEQKQKLQEPDAELSRIKVQVKAKRARLKEFAVNPEIEQLPELIAKEETVLRNINMRKEMGIAVETVNPLPVEEIEHARKILEEDEKKLYEVRKSIHAAKEVLSFMEFRFSEIDQMMSKGGFKDLKAGWKELQQRKNASEQYVNGKQTIVRRAVERLFEVRQELQEIEHPMSPQQEQVSPEEALQEAIEHMKTVMEAFKEDAVRFGQLRETLNQEFAALEMTLEELWRSL